MESLLLVQQLPLEVPLWEQSVISMEILYCMSKPEKRYSLVSYIGYKKRKSSDGNKPLAITLIENMAMLDEVVVVGIVYRKSKT